MSEAAARDALVAAIAATSRDLLGAPPDEVALVAPGALLRTASGKLRRSATRDAWVAGRLGRAPAPVAVQLARFAAGGASQRWRNATEALPRVLFGLYAWLVIVVVGAVAWAAVLTLPGLRARWRAARGIGRVARALLGVRLSAAPELATLEGPAIAVVNHSSWVDAPSLFLALSRPVVFVTSTELQRHRLYGPLLRRLGCVFVERGQPGRGAESVSTVVEAAKAGEIVVVFPEGSLSRAEGLRHFQLGAFQAAAGAACPVVPLGLVGTRRILAPGTWWPRSGSIDVRVGPARRLAGEGFESVIALRDAARRDVAELSGLPMLGERAADTEG